MNLQKSVLLSLTLLTGLSSTLLLQAFEKKETEKLVMKPATIKQMVKILRSEPNPAKVKAAFALGGAGVKTPLAVNTLKSLLDNESPLVRSAAVYALGETGLPEVRGMVLPLLKDGNPRVRAAVCQALMSLNVEVDVNLLPLDDKYIMVRTDAARLLAELRPKGRKRFLLKRLDDEEDDTVKAYLIHALDGVEMDKVVWEKLRQYLVDQSTVVRKAVMAVLASQTEPLPEIFEAPLRKALKAPAAHERAAAVEVAKRFEAGRPLVLSAADDHHSVVQERVAENLVGYEFDAAIQKQLMRFCRADNRFVRRAASETLVAYGRDAHEEQVVQLALELLQSDASFVRCEAIWILGTLKNDAGFPEVFEHAAKTPGAFDETYLSQKESVVENRMVAWIVRRNQHKPASARMLTYALQDKDDLLRVHANVAIAALDYKEAVPPLSKALLANERKGKKVYFVYRGIGRAEALKTLGKLGTPKAFETIEKLLQFTSPVEQFKHLEIMCEALVEHDYKQASDLLGEVILSPPAKLEGAADILWLYSDTLYKLTGNRVTPEIERPDTEGKHESHFFLNVKD